jgi:hypothetical protein
MSIFVIPKTYRTVNSRDHSPVLWLTFEEEMWRLHSRYYFLSRPMLYLLQEHILHPMTLFMERREPWRAAAHMGLNAEAVSCCGFPCRYSTSLLIRASHRGQGQGPSRTACRLAVCESQTQARQMILESRLLNSDRAFPACGRQMM